MERVAPMTEARLPLSAVMLNVNSVRRRIDWLRSLAGRVEVVGLTETWLPRGEYPMVKGWRWFGSGLAFFVGRSCGGVALGLTGPWGDGAVQVEPPTLVEDSVWVRSAGVLFGMVYTNTELSPEFAASVAECLHALRRPGEPVLLGGDFNADIHRQHGQAGDRLRDLVDDICLHFADTTNRDPTYVTVREGRRSESTLDYLMITDHFSVTSFSVGPPVPKCEHRPLWLIGTVAVKRSAAPKRHRARRVRWNAESATQEQRAAFGAALECGLNVRPRKFETADEQWSTIANTIISAGRQHIGQSRLSSRAKPWWSRELGRLFAAKMAQRGTDAVRGARASFQRAKRRAIRNVAAAWRIEDHRGLWRLRELLAKDVASEPPGRADQIPGAEWVRHFTQSGTDDSLGVTEGTDQPPALEGLQIMACPPVSLEEIALAIAGCDAGAAGGPDNIPTLFFKIGGPALCEALRGLYQKIIDTAQWPRGWETSRLVPLFKGKGDPLSPASYRPIALSDVAAKIFARVLNQRISAHLEPSLIDEQGGFRPGRSTVSQIIGLLSLLALRRSESKATTVCFLDIRKAFDVVPRPLLWATLRAMGVDEKTLNVLQAMYGEVVMRLTIVGAPEVEFRTFRGLRQGCPLSPTLYLAFVNDLFDELRKRGRGVVVGGRLVPGLLFADDIVLFAADDAQMQEMLAVLEAVAARKQFQFNVPKCCTLEVPRNRQLSRSPALHLHGEPVPVAKWYTYLGAEIRYDLSGSTFIDKVTRKAAGVRALLFRMSSHAGGLPLPIMRQLWLSLGRPVLEYGAACYPLADPEAFDAAQWRMGRQMLVSGGQSSGAFIQAELDWRSMVARRQVATLREWGHIAMMPEGRLVRHVVEACRAHVAKSRHEIRGAWPTACVKMLRDVGLEEYIDMARVEGVGWAQWCTMVERHVRDHELARWKKRMQQRVELTLYRDLKQAPCSEQYLVTMSPQGRRIAAQMRAGHYHCDAFLARWSNRPERHHKGICRCCSLRESETIEHILRRCPAYNKLRILFWLETHALLGVLGWGQLMSMGSVQWQIMLGRAIPDLGFEQMAAVLRVADKFLVAVHTARIAILSSHARSV